MADQKLLKEAMTFLEGLHNGEVPKGALEAYAKQLPETNSLRQEFEWDNDKAGYAWRLVREGQLIRSLRTDIMTDTGPVRVKAYTLLPSASHKTCYVHVRKVGERVARKKLIRQVMRQLRQGVPRAKDMVTVGTHNTSNDGFFDDLLDMLHEYEERFCQQVDADIAAQRARQAQGANDVQR